ncbi:MAG: Abi family protein [Alphaproteobacteria bacterium]|nr:Abi family protein [Alphaproteobacteria bacterium]
MQRVKFFKESKTPDELIEQLVKRGMVITNRDYAKDILFKINYYRLSGYWFKFQNKWLKQLPVPENATSEEIDELNNQFIRRVSFENIVDIYRFDSKLRSLCIDALEKIEIGISSVLCNHMCQKYGGYWFLNKQLVQKVTKKTKEGEKVLFNHDLLMEDIDKLLAKNKRTKCIKNFRVKYTDEYPPYWILAQLVTFGTLSKIYSSLPPVDKKEIAKMLGVNDELLSHSLTLLSYIRNICAHYARLWDNDNSVVPLNINFNRIEPNSIFNYRFHTNGKNSATFFPVFYLITLYLYMLYPKSKWCSIVEQKIKEYEKLTDSLVSFKTMGFLDTWRELPLFIRMLKNA